MSTVYPGLANRNFWDNYFGTSANYDKVGTELIGQILPVPKVVVYDHEKERL